MSETVTKTIPCRWYTTELTTEQAETLRLHLLRNGYKHDFTEYHNLVHIEVYCSIHDAERIYRIIETL